MHRRTFVCRDRWLEHLDEKLLQPVIVVQLRDTAWTQWAVPLAQKTTIKSQPRLSCTVSRSTFANSTLEGDPSYYRIIVS
eukprot:166414-Prorocentrum_minimum.AAC.3